MRKLKIKGAMKFSTIKSKTERRDLTRLEKAEQRAHVDLEIEKELLDRLKMGTYGELYDDLVNLNPKALTKYGEENELDEIDEEVSFESAELNVS